MQKIFKKSLALAVSAALCLTAFIGCLTVNAAGEASNPSYVVEDVTGAPGDTVEINVTGSNIINICGQLLDVKLGNGLTFVKAYNSKGELLPISDPEGVGDYNLINGSDGSTIVRFVEIINFRDETPTENFDLTIEATIPEEAVAGTTYDVTLDGQFANIKEEWVVVDIKNGVVTVESGEPAEPVIDESLQLGRTILARDKMGVRFMTVKEQLATYDDYYIEVKTQHFVTNDISNPYELTSSTDKFVYVAVGSETPDGFHSQAAEDTNYHYFDYTGITAYEMTLPIEVTIYCLDAEDNIVAKSQTWSFTLADRILTNEMTNSAADAALVDMINYGAAVQTYFAGQNPDSDLAKAALPTVGFDAYQQYATTDVDAGDAVNINNGTATADANGAVIGKGLQVQATNQLYFMIMAGENDIADLTLKVNYVDSYDVDKSSVAKVSEMTSSNSIYYYYCEDDKNVALYDTAKPVVAELYAGDTLLYTRTYSVESFVAESMQEGALKDVGDMLMRFTKSLRAKLALD